MSLLKRIFGICETKPPIEPEAWWYTDDRVVLDLKKLPELSEPGNAIRLEGKKLPERILLLYDADGKFHAFQNCCAHMGRRIDPVAGTRNIRCCSVFQSTYDYSGSPISGAAKSPIKTYPVEAENGKLIISLNSSIGF